MQTAFDHIPSRRSALQGVGAVIATMAGAAIATSPASDAELIELCVQVRTVAAEIGLLVAARTDLEYEAATNAQLEQLFRQQDALMAEIDDAGPPQTMAGIKALAAAALSMHIQHDTDGVRVTDNDGEFLMLLACEALTANA